MREAAAEKKEEEEEEAWQAAVGWSGGERRERPRPGALHGTEWKLLLLPPLPPPPILTPPLTSFCAGEADEAYQAAAAASAAGSAPQKERGRERHAPTRLAAFASPRDRPRPFLSFSCLRILYQEGSR